MAIRPTILRNNDREHGPFPPILSCAVVLSVLIRCLEIYFFITTIDHGFFFFWQFPVFGPLGMADLLLLCTLLILIIALLEAILDPRSRTRWGVVVYCLLLAVYSRGIRFYSQRMMES
jgi:hypothetical protein